VSTRKDLATTPAAPRSLGPALVFAMVFPGVMAWLYFVVLAGERPAGTAGAPEANPILLAAYMVAKILQFSFPLIYLKRIAREKVRLARPHFRGVVPGLAFGLAVAAGMGLIYHFWLRDYLVRLGTPDKIRAKVQDFGLATPGGFLLLAGFIAILHSLLEEYYWRWFVFGRLRQLVPVGGAVLVASVAFMAHHVIVLAVYLPGGRQFWTAVLPFSLCVGAGGAVWCWLYHRSGSIYSPWVSHLAIDLAIMAVGYDLLFG
jgi:membrane protease YdiL (CAAX protease family)